MVKILSIKVGIIGAGPAGMASALYLKRSGLDPVLLEKSAPGGQVVSTFAVENYLGFNEINGADLSLKMFDQMNYHKIEYKTFDIKDIIKKDLPITKVMIDRIEAIKYFKEIGNTTKASVLRYNTNSYISFIMILNKIRNNFNWFK